jgi:hypothetical protein
MKILNLTMNAHRYHSLSSMRRAIAQRAYERSLLQDYVVHDNEEDDEDSEEADIGEEQLGGCSTGAGCTGRASDGITRDNEFNVRDSFIRIHATRGTLDRSVVLRSSTCAYDRR